MKFIFHAARNLSFLLTHEHQALSLCRMALSHSQSPVVLLLRENFYSYYWSTQEQLFRQRKNVILTYPGEFRHKNQHQSQFLFH